MKNLFFTLEFVLAHRTASCSLNSQAEREWRILMNNNLDSKYFFPEVFQAVAGDDYTVYAYMNDGAIRKVDIKPFFENAGVFEQLKDKEIFKKTLTVIGNTVAWDLDGNRDEYKCIDIDPFLVFNSPIVSDIPELE